ncbi:MAG: phage holin, LLH family [Anaeroplasmataceae bacterium]
MDLEYILSLAGTSLGIIITILTFIIKLSKNTKVRKKAEKLLIMTSEIMNCVKEAEKFKNYTGLEKKNYVLTKINQYSIDNNIKYDEEYVSQRIEEIIETTKTVNTNNEDENQNNKKDWLE